MGDEIPENTRVISRFSLQDFSGRVSDISALIDVAEYGGQVRAIKGLHSKVLIFGYTRDVVTSANLTKKGLSRNAEFGCISSDSSFVETCHAYFETLWSEGGRSVTNATLRQWAAEVTAFLVKGSTAGKRSSLPDYGATSSHGATAPVDVGPPLALADEVGVEPAWLAEASLGRVKFFGRARERVPISTPVVQEVDGSGSHWSRTYSKNKRPRSVQDGEVMYLAVMTDDPDDHLVHGRAAGLAYVAGRDDATPDDIELRFWREEFPRYIRVHEAEFVAGVVGNGVKLSDLMDELEAQGFASTQENAAEGLGNNTNPRKALMQKPHVRLSSEGLAWLNARFDAALVPHGRLPAEDLAGLDWPEVPGAV